MIVNEIPHTAYPADTWNALKHSKEKTFLKIAEFKKNEIQMNF